MMAEKGLNDASRGGWIMHREGRNIASRRNGECIAMEVFLHRDAEKRAFFLEKVRIFYK